MSKKFKFFIIGFLTCMIFTTAVSAAAPADISIKALLSNTFKLKLFGKDFVPKDNESKFIKPLVYDGNIYLPVKTVGNALGVPVETDMTKKIVWIGGIIQAIPVNDAKMYEDYSKTILTSDISKLTTAETTYKWGIANDKKLSSVYYGCYLKPDSKYKRFTASVFADGESKYETVLEFRKNDRKGEVLKSITLVPGQTTEIDINIGGVDKLFIISEIHGTYTSLIIGEPTFRNDAQKASTEVK